MAGGLLIGPDHATPSEGGFNPTYDVMDGTQGADKTAEYPAEKKGKGEQAEGPPEALDETVTGQQAGEPYQGVKLKEKCDRLTESEIQVRGKNQRILQVSIFRQTAFYKEEKKQA